MAEEKKGCCCPYCEAEMGEEHPAFCQACGVTINYCAACRAPLPRAATACPQCGAPVGA